MNVRRRRSIVEVNKEYGNCEERDEIDGYGPCHDDRSVDIKQSMDRRTNPQMNWDVPINRREHNIIVIERENIIYST